MKLTDILTEDLVIPDLQAAGKSQVLEEMASALRGISFVHDSGSILKALLEREKLGSTGIGFNVAIPHAKVKEAKDIAAVFGRSVKGIDFDSLDQKPVHLICLLIAPEDSVGTHIKALARISRLLKDENFRKDLMKASSRAEMYEMIKSKDEGLN
ncbi:MAG: PTS sugar transporter subunit IIA [Nitrospinae bacterium]|nr:PTS sugar transporter subunit IIA [Nitrospinota bacterium]